MTDPKQWCVCNTVQMPPDMVESWLRSKAEGQPLSGLLIKEETTDLTPILTYNAQKCFPTWPTAALLDLLQWGGWCKGKMPTGVMEIL